MWLVIVVLLVVLVLYLVGIYNRLVTARNGAKNAFAQIDVQLTRRHDLVPNLVEVAKGYLQHERNTLEAVIQARNQAVSGLKAVAANPASAGAMAVLAGAENQLSSALGRLFALAEAYPDLKANQNFLALQEELASTENKIGYARQFYNDTVTRYNAQLQTFPANLVGNTFGFQPRDFFEIEVAAQREAPKVQF